MAQQQEWNLSGLMVDSPEATKLTPAEEQQFQQWTTSNKITDLDHPDSHYDYRGYWKSTKGAPHATGAHFPDMFKQHGHPTFSVESKYSKGAQDGGRWEGDKFIPPAPPKYGRAAAGQAQGEVLLGFGREAVRRVTSAGDVLRQRFPALGKFDVQEPAWMKPSTKPTPGEQFGAKVEPYGEFVAGGATSRGMTGATRLVTEAMTTFGLAKSQGDPHAMATTLLAAVPSAAFLKSPAAWHAGAEHTMTRLLETATESSEAAKKAIQKVLPLALDSTLLRLTKGRWARAVAVSREAAGKRVGAVLESPVGSQMVPVQPVVDALEKLKDKAMNIVPVGRSGVARGAEEGMASSTIRGQAAEHSARQTALEQERLATRRATPSDIPSGTVAQDLERERTRGLTRITPPSEDYQSSRYTFHAKPGETEVGRGGLADVEAGRIPRRSMPSSTEPPRAYKAVAFNERQVRIIDKLQGVLRDHGEKVQVRQLVNLRRDWDDFVFRGKQLLNRTEIRDLEGRAKIAATDAIREVIQKDVPRLAEVDKVFSLHTQLYDMIADEALGKSGTIPHGGISFRNQVARRAINLAFNSPSWRLATAKTKLAIADALANGTMKDVLLLVRPIIAGTVKGRTSAAETEAPAEIGVQ